MKRSRDDDVEGLNRVYVITFNENLPDSVGSFLFTDEEVASLLPMSESVPSQREAAVHNSTCAVLRKVFEYEGRDDEGVYERGVRIKNKVPFERMMEEPGRALVFLLFE